MHECEGILWTSREEFNSINTAYPFTPRARHNLSRRESYHLSSSSQIEVVADTYRESAGQWTEETWMNGSQQRQHRLELVRESDPGQLASAAGDEPSSGSGIARS
jgi:hypothetical protein